MGKTGKKVVDFFNIFVDAAARGATCTFTSKVVKGLTQTTSRDNRPSVNSRPTRFVSGKVAECI